MAEERLTRVLAVIVVVQMVVICYEVVRFRNENEVAQVQAELNRLETERDSIRALVAINAELQESLRKTIGRKESEAESLRDRVADLEQQRIDHALTVRNIRKTSDLEARLESTFPEMASSSWGVTKIPFEPGDTLGIEYLVVPVWFAETFIIDHQNAESWLEQKDKLIGVDSLRAVVTAFQDSVATLREQNVLALQAGYDNASSACRDISTRYIAELRKPRMSIGSTVGLCVGAAGAGAVIATLVNR